MLLTQSHGHTSTPRHTGAAAPRVSDTLHRSRCAWKRRISKPAARAALAPLAVQSCGLVRWIRRAPAAVQYRRTPRQCGTPRPHRTGAWRNAVRARTSSCCCCFDRPRGVAHQRSERARFCKLAAPTTRVYIRSCRITRVSIEFEMRSTRPSN